MCQYGNAAASVSSHCSHMRIVQTNLCEPNIDLLIPITICLSVQR
jgi:hypothetical protein